MACACCSQCLSLLGTVGLQTHCRYLRSHVWKGADQAVFTGLSVVKASTIRSSEISSQHYGCGLEWGHEEYSSVELGW